jgi:hypothetical protein
MLTQDNVAPRRVLRLFETLDAARAYLAPVPSQLTKPLGLTIERTHILTFRDPPRRFQLLFPERPLPDDIPEIHHRRTNQQEKYARKDLIKAGVVIPLYYPRPLEPGQLQIIGGQKETIFNSRFNTNRHPGVLELVQRIHAEVQSSHDSQSRANAGRQLAIARTRREQRARAQVATAAEEAASAKQIKEAEGLLLSIRTRANTER